VDNLKCLGAEFTSEGRRNRDFDTWVGEAYAVQRDVYRSVVTKQALSNTAKLTLFK